MSDQLKAPFPWFGGKSRVADLVWKRFGDTPNYVEPFFGSGAVLLGRKTKRDRITETVNDADGFVSNFWRAIQADPGRVASYADWPVNENDLHARHAWLVGIRDTFRSRLEGDPDFFDAKVAGWWVWGCSSWIGSGWCSGRGPWSVREGEDGTRQLVHLGDAGMGVNRQLVHLGDAGRGIHKRSDVIADWFSHLSSRLRNVRIACGDWSRVTGDSVTTKHGLTAVFLDPPYSNDADCQTDLYATGSRDVAHDARSWAIENGDDPLLRIALCGYSGEHSMPEGWVSVNWKAKGGYGSQGDGRGRANCERETVWFSPHCLKPNANLLEQVSMFSEES